MSSFATAWAWEQKVEQNEKLILLFLADSADRSGSGNNLLDLLDHAKNACGLDGQTIKKHTETLKESKLVQATPEGGYRLALGAREPTLGSFRLKLEDSN